MKTQMMKRGMWWAVMGAALVALVGCSGGLNGGQVPFGDPAGGIESPNVPADGPPVSTTGEVAGDAVEEAALVETIEEESAGTTDAETPVAPADSPGSAAEDGGIVLTPLKDKYCTIEGRRNLLAEDACCKVPLLQNSTDKYDCCDAFFGKTDYNKFASSGCTMKACDVPGLEYLPNDHPCCAEGLDDIDVTSKVKKVLVSMKTVMLTEANKAKVCCNKWKPTRDLNTCEDDPVGAHAVCTTIQNDCRANTVLEFNDPPCWRRRGRPVTP